MLSNLFDSTIKIKNKIIMFVFLLLAVVLLTAGVLVERIFVYRVDERLGRNALDIAHSVSKIPEIREHVGRAGGHLVIQPLAEAVRLSTSAEFVVVMDMDSYRYSHPVPERIGEKFVGGDEGKALQGEVYTSRATGTLGPSLRAFVPIYRGGEQAGVVSVGILVDDIMIIIRDIRFRIFLAALASLLVGMIGSGYLARNIKKAMLGLEPHEISALLHEREAVLQSVREGIIAVDGQGRIILVNSEAKRLLRIYGDAVEQDAADYLPGFPLSKVLEDGKSFYDVEQSINNIRVMSNTIPILDEKSRVKGAIVSFRDMTEVWKIAEELTGVMKFVETVRVQNHEYSNKLHTISGLIQLGDYERAVSFISESAASHRQLISMVSERIKHPAVAAVLLGKTGKARELGVHFRINPDSYLGELKKGLEWTTLVTIIGNLVDNAMEAVMDRPEGNRQIELSILDEFDSITINVKDSGPGMSPEIREKIFDKGFTTREGGNRGLGLYIVKSLLETLNGEIAIESSDSSGTELSLYIPQPGGGVN
jgi:sensor histidine kinase regulating citrate/malate metabolism